MVGLSTLLLVLLVGFYELPCRFIIDFFQALICYCPYASHHFNRNVIAIFILKNNAVLCSE
jgi:hypothetical protein